METTKASVNQWDALRPAIETMVRSHLPLDDVQEMFCKAYVQAAVALNQGNISRASRAIRVHRNTIYRYIGPR